jgi:predicted dehydrogenase
VKIAVIGAGRMGCRRIAALRAMGERDITVYDVDTARVEVVATQFGIATAPIYEGNPWFPDVVFVCTPPASHWIDINRAYGWDATAIFVEKPLATELRDYTYPNCITCCGANLRYHPSAVAIKHWLDAGVIGHVRAAHVWAGYDLRTTRPDWRTSYAATTGATLDVGSHVLDLMLDWLGPATLHSAKIEPATNIGLHDIDGSATLHLLHASDAHSTVSASFVRDDYAQGALLLGERGCLGYSWATRQAYWHQYGTGNTERVTWDESATERTYGDETSAFMACVRDQRETPNSIARASRVLAILLVAKESWQASTPSAVQ